MADPVGTLIGVFRLALQSLESWKKWRTGKRPKPRWFEGTSSEYRELLTRLEVDEYEIKEPTPGGAHQYRDDGWTQVTTADHRSVFMGGTPEAPHHLPVCRRLATYGLSDEAKKLIVASYLNPYRHHSFLSIQAGYKIEPRLVADGLLGLELKGAVARRVLEELERRDLIMREVNDHIYYGLKVRAAEGAEWMIARRRVRG
jgi:hypothetical protein